MARMSMAVNWLAKQANRAMRLMGWVSVALMIFEAGKALYEWIAGTDEAAEREKVVRLFLKSKSMRIK